MSATRHDPPSVSDESAEVPPGLHAGTVVDAGRHPLARFLMQVLWPAFLGAAISVGLLFSLVDPFEIDAVHVHLGGSRELAYTCGFIALWLLYALACALTWLLSTSDRRNDPP